MADPDKIFTFKKPKNFEEKLNEVKKRVAQLTI